MACEVKWLKAGEDKDEIERLTALAEEQQTVLSPEYPDGAPAKNTRSKLRILPFDTMITPWKSQFGTQPNWHFVAQNSPPDGPICGWLTAQIKSSASRNYIYLSEISTRRIKDKLYGGVGTRLHDALVAAAMNGGYDFIYLYPVSEAVSKIYVRWGYTSQLGVLRHQFYVLPGKQGPTDAMIKSLLPPRPAVGVIQRAREVIGPGFDEHRRDVLADPDNVKEVELLLNEFDEDNAAAELPERTRRPEQLAKIAAADAARLKNQNERMSDLLESMKNPKGGRRKTARNTHRLRFLRKHNLPEHGYSVGELSKISHVPRPILRQVYDRGIGAYKTNPTSVRMKGTFKKGVKAPYSKKLSKEQWAMARVYSFLDGNPKHDGDLRRKTRRRHK